MTAASSVADRAETAPRRLGRTTRRAVLVAHLVAAGTWIGIDVVIGLLVFTAATTGDPSTEALSHRALELVAIWPLLGAGLATLATGVVLGLGTSYGLVRHWWVASKLALNLVLVAAVAFALRPSVLDAAAYGEALSRGAAGAAPLDDLIPPPIVSMAALVAAVVLSVFKPWGRTRRRAGS